MKTDPPEVSELRFTMTPTYVGRWDGVVVFKQLEKGLQMNFELSVPSTNEYDKYNISATNCSSKMPHLYIIKDTSCCTDPMQYKCSSVYGMKLECLLGSGN